MRLLFLFPLLLLTACEANDFTGTLSLKRPLTVQTGRGAAQLAAGNYQARIAVTRDGGSVSVGQVRFGLPPVQPGPAGRVRLSAAELGQPFSLDGSFTESSGPFDRTDTRSCIWMTTQEYICQDGENGSACWQDVHKYGRETVRLTGTWTQRQLKLQVLSGGRAVGSFAASQRASERVTHEEVLSGCAPNM
jgi:hypothetical protein